MRRFRSGREWVSTCLLYLVGIAVLCAPSRASGQRVPPTNNAAAIGANVLIGGLTAAGRALIEHRDPARAFAIGALGGGVHFAGKYVASRRGYASGWVGTGIAATGTSILTNAGAGAGALSELHMPIAALRIRYRPSTKRVAVGVNAYEAAVYARYLGRRELAVDWNSSAATGTLVLTAVNRRIVLGDGLEPSGVAAGSLIIVGDRLIDPVTTLKHEFVHVQQMWFMQEAWNRPLEHALRKRSRLTRWIPSWLDLGFLPFTVQNLNHMWFGRYRGISNLQESEAELLERP